MTKELMQAAVRPAGPASVSADPASASRLAQALRHNRHAIALALLANIADWPKYAADARQDPDLFVRRELYSFVDYLALAFSTGDEAYRSLYAGEKLKQIYHPGEAWDDRRARAERLLQADEAALVDGLAGAVGPAEVGLLRGLLGRVRDVILGEAPRTLEILFIGDCLFLDIQAFLPAPCLEDGVAIKPTFVTTKNGVAQRETLRALAGTKFDLVFYSPLTYGFSPPFSSTLDVRHALDARAKIESMVDAVMADVEATIVLLASLFDCTTFVHNTINLRRQDGTAADLFRAIVTVRARRIAAKLANARIEAAIARANAETFEHVLLFDERLTAAGRRESDLGRIFYDTDFQHPAVLGREFAARYRDLVAAQAGLVGRKLIVCDLDHTLWDGVIGEGAVVHFIERQGVLRKLREKGVVLAVNSKNDPANVRWDGAVLGPDDFVHMQINWDNKVANMRRIHEALNLKFKDYVFIDDRGDQLALVGEALPEIRGMDATDDRTWKLLAAWESLLPAATEGDRTALYRQREEREGFVASLALEDEAALFANLGIRATIREAGKGDLRRVVELINRTNQFNTAGSRTSQGEVNAWHQDPNRRILVIDAADKFGAMGLVSVALVHFDGDVLRIPAFVLSCRVFGYGIEKALLGTVKRLAAAQGGAHPLSIAGAYRETSHNGPCRSTYPDLGFHWDGSDWIFRGGEIHEDDPWLSVDDRVCPAPPRPHLDHAEAASPTHA
jgi:FkbH-like protein